MAAIVCPGCGLSTEGPYCCVPCWNALPSELQSAIRVTKRAALTADSHRPRERFEQAVAAMHRWFVARRESTGASS